MTNNASHDLAPLEINRMIVVHLEKYPSGQSHLTRFKKLLLLPQVF
jgi:hypothetical protein